MATTILFVFSLCVLYYTVSSVPVLDLKSVDIGTKKTFDVTEEVNLKKVTVEQSFEVPLYVGPSDVKSVKRLSRVKRQVIVYHGCPDGTIWYARQCMPFEKYEKILNGEDEE